MSAVSDGLQHAIDQWLDIEGSSFGAGKRLEDMWIEEKGVAKPFQPDGARRLIDKIQDENVFKNCDEAQSLEPDQFGTNRIDDLGDLQDHLVSC
jgi:hypothetical protein